MVTLMGLLPLAGSSARADAPHQQGWWTVTSPQLLPPDVPADGLLVQGAADDPAAVAALLLTIPEDQVAVTVTLRVAAQGATVPGSSLRACPLRQAAFVPVQGGAISDAPAWDCSDSVAATASTDGQTYELSVGPLSRGSTVAFALLGETPTDRVVLARPSADSVSVTEPAVLGGRGDPPVPTPEPTGVTPAPPLVLPLPGPVLTSLPEPSIAPSPGPQPSLAAASAATVALRWPADGANHGPVVAALVIAVVALLGAAQRYHVLHAQQATD